MHTQILSKMTDGGVSVGIGGMERDVVKMFAAICSAIGEQLPDLRMPCLNIAVRCLSTKAPDVEPLLDSLESAIQNIVDEVRAAGDSELADIMQDCFEQAKDLRDDR